MTLLIPLNVFKNAPIMPVQGNTPVPISRGFLDPSLVRDSEKNLENKHFGVDIKIPAGTPVFAVAEGEVIRADVNGACGAGIIIRHLNKKKDTNYDVYYTYYCHLSAINVKQNEQVFAGLHIGRSGGVAGTKLSGDSTGPHLHFELRVKQPNQENFNEATRVDPLPYITEGIKPIVFDDRDLLNKLADESVVSIAPFRTTTISGPASSTVDSITPYISSLESFHPNIQYELTRRKFSEETAQVYMPFVKLTSLMWVKSENLSNNQQNDVIGAVFPSIGLHGVPNERFENIYSIQSNRSIIGYAINEKRQHVPVYVADSTGDPDNIPMPGIADITVERGTAGAMGVRGGLVQAKIKIIAYSVGQTDALLRYFLRPSTKVVLELGQQSSNPDYKLNTFDWTQDANYLQNYFTDLVNKNTLQSEFIKKYIYDNFGRYEMFIGYVVNFKLNVTTSGIYEINLSVHSVQQIEIPNTLTGVKSNCNNVVNPNKLTDIHSYFSPENANRINSFRNLLDTFKNNSIWKSHIIYRSTDETADTKVEKSESKTQTMNNAYAPSIGKGIGGYYITWKFFVEQVLHNPSYGILSLFPPQSNNESAFNYIKTTLIPEYTTNWMTGKPIITPAIIGEHRKLLLPNQVGYHPNLKSTDPSVMVIVNTIDTNRYDSRYNNSLFSKIVGASNINIQTNITTVQMEAHPNGTFSDGADIDSSSKSKAGTSFLMNGVWINTNAIVESFMQTDTVSAALSSLLTKMNAATLGYWNLQLLSNDSRLPGVHVIDYGLSKNPIKPDDINYYKNDPDSLSTLTEKYFKTTDIYRFNKKTKIATSTDTNSIGSELLDIKLEFDLPLTVAVQSIIGVGGVAEKGTLQAYNIPELEYLSVVKALYTCTDTTTTDDNNPCPDIFAGQAYTSDTPELTVQQILEKYPNIVSKVREYGDFGTALKYVELDSSCMIKRLSSDSTIGDDSVMPTDDKEKLPIAHAFNSSNLTKTVVDLTLPGIGGIELFQSFLVDRVPKIVQSGFFVVTKISHEFKVESGWKTKLTGRFRYHPRVIKNIKPKNKV